MREPDLKGIAGCAWKATSSDEVRAKWPTGLDTWLLDAPGFHPIWAHYVITGCSLRDVEGIPPAKKRFANATHEINVIALNPETFVLTDGWCTDSEHRWAKSHMTPLNLSEQIADFTDEKLNELVYLFVRSFCHGHTSPDDDFRGVNRRILERTVDHLRRGLHEVH